MTINDLLTAVRVSDPQISPDGKLVAFVRTTTDLTTGKRNADIWVVPADGSAPLKTKKAADGSCVQNECKQGPGGETFDCASFAALCVDAGEHWSGTKEGGKCTKVI